MRMCSRLYTVQLTNRERLNLFNTFDSVGLKSLDLGVLKRRETLGFQSLCVVKFVTDLEDVDNRPIESLIEVSDTQYRLTGK